jgi:hypothetical protein
MATSLVSTGVQFPDNSIQTTAAGASALVLISTLTASGASNVAWTGLATYDTYLLLFKNVTMSNSYVTYQVGTGGGPTYITSGYVGGKGFTGTASDITSTTISATTPELHFPNTNGPASGAVYFYNMTGANKVNAVSQVGQQRTGLSMSFANSYQNVTTGPYTAIKIAPETSTFSGTFSLYGISQ